MSHQGSQEERSAGFATVCACYAPHVLPALLSNDVDSNEGEESGGENGRSDSKDLEDSGDE